MNDIRRGIRFAWAVALLTIAFTPLHAQLVRGRVTVLTDSVPVAGVLVQLVDPAGRIVAQVLSDQRGAYAMRAPNAGSYWLRALRIGFRPTASDAFSIAASGTTQRGLVLNSTAVTLSAASVSATERCDVEGDTTSLGFRAWEQARTALSASLVTRESSTYDMEFLVAKLSRELQRDSVIRYSEEVSHTNASRPFTAFPLSRLRDSGYVVRNASEITVAAPDEEILLSDDFVETHCMHALPPQGDSIVLVFEPVRERKLSDVAGALVLSRATSELRSLRFEYVNVPREERETHAGGDLTFLRFPSGGWIVQRWRLRYPVLERREQRTFDRQGGSRVDVNFRVIEWQETRGEAVRVQENGQLVWRAPTTTLYGVVRDDSLAHRVPGADVRMTGASRGATTDSAGRFVLQDVRRGDVEVLISTPSATALGIGPHRVHVASQGDSTTVELTAPHPVRVVEAACDAAGFPLSRNAERSMLRGTVRDAFGSRAGVTDISITWAHQERGPASEIRERRVRSSATGDFASCGLPVGVPLDVRALVGDVVVGRASASIPLGAVGVVVTLLTSIK